MRNIAANIFILAAFIHITNSCSTIAAQVTPSYEHVVILAFDGWGASSYNDANMPFLKSMIPNSAWTIHKRSILPTSSACNWATMFKGVGPEAHGYIAWDTKTPAFTPTDVDKNGNFPSLFSLFREKNPGKEMVYLYQWEGMKYIFDINDFSYTKEFPVTYDGSEKMKDAAASYMKNNKPGLAFFAWDYPDKTGHKIGWYTSDYMAELAHIDNIIKGIFDACSEAGISDNTLFVITSDHGGHDQGHGEPLMSDLETPFILFGKGVVPGEIMVPLMQYDVASILANYMGLKQPDSWRGITPISFQK